MTRAWVCFSSSSGQTFKALHAALTPAERKALQAVFTDRPCGARAVAEELGLLVIEYPRKEFEARWLEWVRANNFNRDGLILLCGFFGILSESFLGACPAAIVNTHPSLLPAFPGKDEAVHRRAVEEATISGFSVHLVNEKLDGGPILFQHPVAIDHALSVEDNRARVRAAEQRWLPRVWSRLLAVPLQAEDRHLSTRELRVRYGLGFNSFSDKETLI